jgi:hypothetical protein
MSSNWLVLIVFGWILQIWDYKHRVCKFQYQPLCAINVDTVAFTPDGNCVTFATVDGYLQVCCSTSVAAPANINVRLIGRYWCADLGLSTWQYCCIIQSQPRCNPTCHIQSNRARHCHGRQLCFAANAIDHPTVETRSRHATHYTDDSNR